MEFIYLDANASMPPLPAAKEALIKVLDNLGNASSPHVLGRRQRALLDEARFHVAKALNADAKQIFFNSGASEGNRWFLDAILNSDLNGQNKPKIIATSFEHPSLMRSLQHAFIAEKIEFNVLKPGPNGQIALDAKLIEDADVVFAATAHSETGILFDWDALFKVLHQRTIVITDATQSFARIPTGALPDRVDAVVISAHKMGGIMGTGAVLLRNNAKKLSPPWKGGGQEGGLRPGTECLPLIVAFGAAAKEIEQTRQRHVQLEKWRDEIENELLAAWPFAQVLGRNCPRIPNTSALVLNGVDGEALRIAIDSTGVSVGFGLACSALAPEPSPALLAMGLTPAQARSTIRISLPMNVTKAEIDEALSRLKPAVARLKTI